MTASMRRFIWFRITRGREFKSRPAHFTKMISLWAMLALAAVAVWALGNILEKIAIDKYFRVAPLAIFYVIFLSLIASIVVSIFFDVVMLPISLLFTSLLIGVIWTGAILLFFHALSFEEVSRVIPLFAFVPIYVLIISTFLFNEIFLLSNYLGIALIVAGSAMISLKKEVKIKISKSFWVLLGSSFLAALAYVGVKYITNYTTYWNTYFWIGIGSLLLLPILIITHGKQFIKTSKEHPISVLYGLTFESVDMIGRFLGIMAISVGAVSLVSTLGQTQPLFVLLFAVVLSVYYPKVLREELSKSILSFKLIAILLTIAGVLLIV